MFHEADDDDIKLDLIQHFLSLLPSDLIGGFLRLSLVHQELDLLQTPEEVIQSLLRFIHGSIADGKDEVIEVHAEL